MHTESSRAAQTGSNATKGEAARLTLDVVEAEAEALRLAFAELERSHRMMAADTQEPPEAAPSVLRTADALRDAACSLDNGAELAFLRDHARSLAQLCQEAASEDQWVAGMGEAQRWSIVSGLASVVARLATDD